MSNRPVSPHNTKSRLRISKMEVLEVEEPRATVLLMQSCLSITLAGAPEKETLFFASHSVSDSVAVLRHATGLRTVWEIKGGALKQRQCAIRNAYEALAKIHTSLKDISEEFAAHGIANAPAEA